jgi:glucose/mannose transport system substrate-binding protein
VAEFAKALTPHRAQWVDGAIAGGGGTARPIMISRITGGDPMAATQFNHGRQAEELVEAGLMLDLTELAEAEGWKDIVHPCPCSTAARSMGASIAFPSTSTRLAVAVAVSREAFETAGVPMCRPIGMSSLPRPPHWKRPASFRSPGQQPWQSNLPSA